MTGKALTQVFRWMPCLLFLAVVAQVGGKEAAAFTVGQATWVGASVTFAHKLRKPAEPFLPARVRLGLAEASGAWQRRRKT